MIRDTLENGYKKTVGAFWNWFSRSLGAAANRWGILQLVYVVVAIGLLAGFVDAVVLPLPSVYQAEPVYSGTGQQTIPETFIDAMVILLGGAGIYLTYISGRQTTKSRMVNLYLGFAILLITVSVMMGLYLVTLKG
jgi:hypothetical protein